MLLGVRTGKKCPGYYDASQLMVRDETMRVIEQVRASKGQAAESPPPPSHCSSNSKSSTSSSRLRPQGSPSSLVQTEDNPAPALPRKGSKGNGRRADEGREDGVGNGQTPDNISGKKKRQSQEPTAAEQLQPTATNDPKPTSDETVQLIADLAASWTSDPEDSTQPLPSRLTSPFHTESLWNIQDQTAEAAPSQNILPATFHQLAVNYFIIHFVVPPSGPCPGFFGYVPDFLSDPSSGDTSLAELAIRAVGLAGLASTTRAEHLMTAARASYAEAIMGLNIALQNPHSNNAKSDSTILAVLVLGLFETMTCSDNNTMEAWGHHVNGAAQLIIHRGSAQLRTKRGRLIFGEALSHILTLCSRTGETVAPRLRFLRVELQRHLAPKPPSWILSTNHIEVLDLYHQVQPEQDTPFLPAEWEKLLSHAFELEQRLDSLIAELPVSWRYKIVQDPLVDARIAYRGTYHVYYNTWVAKVWNGLRASRIILDEAICSLIRREAFTWTSEEFSSRRGEYTLVLERALEAIAKMRDGIFASVPQMLGFVQHETATGASHLDFGSGPDGHGTSAVPASGAYFLLWHLYLAGSLQQNTPSIRNWAVDRLRAIQTTTGIRKAGYLADLIESESSPNL